MDEKIVGGYHMDRTKTTPTMEPIGISKMQAISHVKSNFEPTREPHVVPSSEKSTTDTPVVNQQLDNLICEKPASFKNTSDMRSQEEFSSLMQGEFEIS